MTWEDMNLAVWEKYMSSAGIKYIFNKKSKKNDGKLIFMDEETYKSLENAEDGLCYKKFKPDIVTERKLSFGEKIEIEGKIFEAEKYAKKCYPECTIKDKNICLILKGYYGFLKS